VSGQGGSGFAHAVEALENVREMFQADSPPGVAHGENGGIRFRGDLDRWMSPGRMAGGPLDAAPALASARRRARIAKARLAASIVFS